MNNNSLKIAVIIVAGGNGTRMGDDLPKQYMLLNNSPILRRTVNKFINYAKFSAIQCVIGKEHEYYYAQAVNGLDILPPVIGGSTRQESVYLGLRALEKLNIDFVLIHDAARPCITRDDIQNVIERLDENKALTLAMPLTETIQRDGASINRDNLWIIQTPQAFNYISILNHHQRAVRDEFFGTDDTSIAHHYGQTIEYIACGRHNIKITTKEDLFMAEKLLQNSMETRIGNGFDVHAFDPNPASSIRLCGVDIPYNKSLLGHSDADVGLHAITDAIFGALADGDIGSHFPPSNMDYKNMDSHIFLDKSVDILKSRGGKIAHIDVTFMCEEPKIGKHREVIRAHLSDHLKLSTDRISVKATTTEKLGFTGRGEGIACQALVTIQLPCHE